MGHGGLPVGSSISSGAFSVILERNQEQVFVRSAIFLLLMLLLLLIFSLLR
jgi:hypothetical protein